MPVTREHERTNLFLIAVLFARGASVPVRVRNLSAVGALIEGADLPPVGAKILLCRGSLKAPGMVVWAAAGRAGLSFSTHVVVSAWLPAKPDSQQSEIDQFVFGLQRPALATVGERFPSEDTTLPQHSAVTQLESLQVELGHLADKLAQDVILVATHPEVQFLDEAAQRIRRIIQTIQTSESVVRALTAQAQKSAPIVSH